MRSLSQKAAKRPQFASTDQQKQQRLNTEVLSAASPTVPESRFITVFDRSRAGYCSVSHFQLQMENWARFLLLRAPADTNWLWLAFLELINFSKRRQKSNFESLHTEKSIKSPRQWKMGLKIEKNGSKLNKRIIPWNNWTQPVHYWHNDCEWQARIGIALIFFLRFLAVCEACQSFVMIFLINLGGNSWSDIDGELNHVLFTFMAVRVKFISYVKAGQKLIGIPGVETFFRFARVGRLKWRHRVLQRRKIC